jgi:hypothetical protein
MNRRLTITAAALVAIVALWFIFGSEPPKPESGVENTGGNAARPRRHRPGEVQPPPDAQKQDPALISFPGMKPLPYDRKWTVSCGELLEKYNHPDRESTRWTTGGTARNTLEIYADKEGRICRIAKNRDAYPSVSGAARIPGLFRKVQDTEIIRFGNDVANIHNRKFMSGLLWRLGDMGAVDHTKFNDGTGEMTRNYEIEIVPVTFRVAPGSNMENVPKGIELPGLLVKQKEKGVSVEQRMGWTEALPPEDARSVVWRIYPINPGPDADDVSIMSGVGFGVSGVYELKIRRPEDPPERPLEPIPIPNGK